MAERAVGLTRGRRDSATTAALGRRKTPEQPAYVLRRLQRTAGNAAVGRLLMRAASQEMEHAKKNKAHLAGETYPGLTQDLGTTLDGVEKAVVAYNKQHGKDPPLFHVLDQAADGLRAFTQTLIESADGSWLEASEMARLTIDKQIPIAGRSKSYDSDVEYHDKTTGARHAIEAKAINSALVGSVTGRLIEADGQLAKRLFVKEHEIAVWIAHGDNQWPAIKGFNARTTDAQVVLDVEAQLNGMNLPTAKTIRLTMVRTPPAHPAKGRAVDVVATGGDKKWKAQVTRHWA